MNNIALMQEAFTGLSPSADQTSEARRKAFNSHFESDWIEAISEKDAKDLLQRVWAICIADANSEGRSYKEHEKYLGIAFEMGDDAEHACGVYVDKNWTSYLGD